MLKFFVLCFLVVVAWGQPPKYPCCSDPTWEGLEGFEVGSDTAGTGSLTEVSPAGYGTP